MAQYARTGGPRSDMIGRIRADSRALRTEAVLCRLGLGPAAPRRRRTIRIGVLNSLSVEQTLTVHDPSAWPRRSADNPLRTGRTWTVWW